MQKFGFGALFIAAIAAVGSVSLIVTMPDGSDSGGQQNSLPDIPISGGDEQPARDGGERDNGKPPGGVRPGETHPGSTHKSNSGEEGLPEPSRTGQDRAEDALIFCVPEPGPVSDQPGRDCLARGQLLSRENDRERLEGENPASKPLSLAMVTPEDPSEPPIRVESCAMFNQLKSDGWGGLTSLDMAREATFEARCGIIKLAHLARLAPASGFRNGRLTASELRNVRITSWPYFGAAPREAEVIDVESLGEGIWELTYAGVQGRLTEVAHADFNEDGRGDVLSYLVITPIDGTARISGFGLFEKKDTDIEFSILSVY